MENSGEIRGRLVVALSENPLFIRSSDQNRSASASLSASDQNDHDTEKRQANLSIGGMTFLIWQQHHAAFIAWDFGLCLCVRERNPYSSDCRWVQRGNVQRSARSVGSSTSSSTGSPRYALLFGTTWIWDPLRVTTQNLFSRLVDFLGSRFLRPRESTISKTGKRPAVSQN